VYITQQLLTINQLKLEFMENKSSAILSGSINLSMIDKSKIINGKKGQYLNITMIVQNQSQYGNNVWITQSQSEEERKSEAKAVSLGNGAVRWVGGEVKVAERDEVTNNQQNPQRATTQEVDLPF
tara:strand:+ start:710 stop:1084 length:375 start_codon:yes stop_codon:yes gene_type:complete